MTDPNRPAHVHGRFQPFHDEHLEYARWAASASGADQLIVGITNADAAHTAPTNADPDRHRPRNNPFTYYERRCIVRAALEAANLPCDVAVVPFPINRPDLWEAYAPPEAIHYVNVLEEWHEHKADRLRERGRTVETKRGTRTVSGTEIRRRMAAGERWDEDVPEPVATVIRERELVDRVERLYANADER